MLQNLFPENNIIILSECSRFSIIDILKWIPKSTQTSDLSQEHKMTKKIPYWLQIQWIPKICIFRHLFLDKIWFQSVKKKRLWCVKIPVNVIIGVILRRGCWNTSCLSFIFTKVSATFLLDNFSFSSNSTKCSDTISIRFLPCILYRGDEAVDITGWWSEIVGVEVGRISGFFTLFDLTGETDLDFLWGCSRLITFDFTGLRIRSPGKNTVVRENVCRSNVFAFMERTKNL